MGPPGRATRRLTRAYQSALSSEAIVEIRPVFEADDVGEELTPRAARPAGGAAPPGRVPCVTGDARLRLDS